ncbi:uncharacterized protein CANTADRAFT_45225 [Suhomyces tanzawaensis NRRL Y-17324]|uniref:Uncharacterized protein n=1 Tax=Suhomyces tanzawaensis NRRL Y-17324 TaxID=984487 RepID=A0A1E4SQZ9_9ASCO|nr:uncharacterized protein CANTADRAFT_45225 [Suhomyces tanzawaensis NRRL Y-17324]ODV81832.1 hypothetical protein CANTADRAFT_45225 [Suhomyces tanzawaensis NRRL Y-17324]
MDDLERGYGQVQALPVSEEGSPVQEYLREVRRQAEQEQSVFYRAKRSREDDDEEEDGPERGAGDQEEIEDSVASQWAHNVVHTFTSLKLVIVPDRQTTPPSPYVPETANQWRKYVLDTSPPQLAYFYTAIDRPTVFKLVVYFTKWLSLSANANLSQWVWMVLLRIDSSMDASELAVIRDLGKKAGKLCSRANTENTDPVARGTLDMIVVVVAHYYGQRDLLGTGLIV